MIQATGGQAVLQLLEKARRRPGDYRRIVISSPFIDEFGLAELERLTRALERRRCPAFDLVVRRPAAEFIRERMGDDCRFRLRVRDDLHAKVYVLLGMDSVSSDGLITSSNLTGAGVGHNLEMGIRLRGADPRVARELEHAVHHVTNPQRSIP